MTGETVAGQPTVQLRLAESMAEIDTARRVLKDQIHTLRRLGEAGESADPEVVRAMNRDRAFATRMCQNALERLRGRWVPWESSTTTPFNGSFAT
jgi:alkylation response protein AidB-like acyl-CoA dehydrogenase